MQAKLTPAFVMNAKADHGAERTIFWDLTMPGFGLVVTDKGAKSYCIQYRAGRHGRRMKINDVLSLDAARKRAKVLLGEVAHGRDPLADKRKAEAKATDTLRLIAENYLKREGKNLRSVKARTRVFERNIFPSLGTMPINDIRRSDVVKLLDRIEDRGGQVAADQTLAFLRRLFSWHASRSDDFRSPIVRGMARTKPDERTRDKILDDGELRAVWKTATATKGPYGVLVRFLMLTAARRDEARKMPHSELGDGKWTLPPERHKTGKTSGKKVLPLSRAAQAVLAELPVLGPYVFSINGRIPMGGRSSLKAKLDKASGVTGWRVHDLRRTARSLMSRAGVNADVAERCLGHVIGGVRGVYDRHDYLEEMRIAFEKLAEQIEHIVKPPA